LKKQVTLASSILAIIASIWAGMLAVDSRYALAKDVVKISKSIEILKLEKVYTDALSNYYNYKTLNKKYPGDFDITKEYDKAKKQLKFITTRMNKLKGIKK